MRFTLCLNALFLSLATTLAIAGCSVDPPPPETAAEDEPVSESRQALHEESAPECAHARCKSGQALDAACNPCVEDVCAVDPFCCQVYWDGLCVSEVESVCGKKCNDNQTYGKCGDGHCQGNEDCSTCPTDCGFCPPECGNSWCEAGEDCNNCSQDCGACPVCGDGVCWFDETCSSCPQDCGACPVCGDGACTLGYETCDSCPQDCTSCGCHDECQSGAPQLSSCGACVSQVCAQDAFCCMYQWDTICVSEAQTLCGLTCN